MAITYSTNLGISLMATGDNSGTWGDVNNNNIGTLLEQAVSGYTTQAVTDGADTVLTITDGSGTGANNTARNMTLELTGTLTAARNVIVPAKRKLYFVYNNTGGGFAVTVKVSGQVGISVPNGKKVVLVCNGTDVVNAVNHFTALSGNIDGAVIGGTTPGAGTFTTVTSTNLVASSSVSGTGFTNYLASPPGIGGTSPSSGSFTTLTSQYANVTGTSAPAAGIYAPASNYLGFSTSNTRRGQITNTGTWLVGPASIGETLVTYAAPGGGAAINAIGASGSNCTINLTDGQAGARIWSIISGLSGAGTFGLFDQTRSVAPFYITSSGNVNIQTPASGVALTVNGLTGNFGVNIIGPAGQGATLCLGGDSGAANWQFTGGTAALNLTINGTSALLVSSTGNVSSGSSVGTTMTNGFFYIPAAAGAPTGVPTAISGRVPMYYDSTNNQFYVYNGAWKKVTLA